MSFLGIYNKCVKRFLDIIMSILALIILSPVLLIIAATVRVILGRPVLFKQKRPGLNEKIFTIYKFRTMTDKKDKSGKLMSDDLRLTRFGKILRSTSLDELPSLYNILKGDMSFVGPRPLAVSYLPYYNEIEKHRHDVRPGMTGLAQINGRNKISWEQRFQYDIDYVEGFNIFMDFAIVIKTIGLVLRRRDIGIAGIDSTENFNDHRLKQLSVVKRHEHL